MRAWRLAAAVTALALWSQGAARAAPERLHIVIEAFTDAAPHSFLYMLELRRAGEEWELRWWRVAPTSESCARIDLKAETTRLSNTAVQRALQGRRNPCADRERLVEEAYRGSREPSIFVHPQTVTVVADCSGERKVWSLPEPDGQLYERLKRQRHVVYELRGLYDALLAETDFEEGEPFWNLTPEEDLRLQEQGARDLEALGGGAYDAGLGWTWGELLALYDGPKDVRTLEPAGRLIAEESTPGLTLSADALVYPPLAKVAGIEGKVRLRYGVDGRTGAVRVAEADGPELLVDWLSESAANHGVTPAPGNAEGDRVAVIEYRLDVEGCEITKSAESR